MRGVRSEHAHEIGFGALPQPRLVPGHRGSKTRATSFLNVPDREGGTPGLLQQKDTFASYATSAASRSADASRVVAVSLGSTLPNPSLRNLRATIADGVRNSCALTNGSNTVPKSRLSVSECLNSCLLLRRDFRVGSHFETVPNHIVLGFA